jgi:hypothetical protein
MKIVVAIDGAAYERREKQQIVDDFEKSQAFDLPLVGFDDEVDCLE